MFIINFPFSINGQGNLDDVAPVLDVGVEAAGAFQSVFIGNLDVVEEQDAAAGLQAHGVADVAVEREALAVVEQHFEVEDAVQLGRVVGVLVGLVGKVGYAEAAYFGCATLFVHLAVEVAASASVWPSFRNTRSAMPARAPLAWATYCKPDLKR